jgi:hypothetical protein
VDAVGADQRVDLDLGAARESRLDAVAALGQPGEAVPEVDASGRYRRGQGAEQVGTVDLVVGKPNAASSGAASGVRSRVRPSSQRR